MKDMYKKARSQRRNGASAQVIRDLFREQGFSIVDADQFLLRETTKNKHPFVRWLWFAGGAYLWALVLFVLSKSLGFTVQQQSVNLGTLALALFAVGFLFRPKPQQLKRRTAFTVVELLFPAACIALCAVLFAHPGWPSPRLPDGGALMSTLWPLMWLGAWLGPQVLAVVALLIGHYALLNIRTSFFVYLQDRVTEAWRKRLRVYYRDQLIQAEFVPENYANNLSVKIVKLLTSHTEWNPKSVIELYALGIQVHVQPTGGGGAVLVATALASSATEGMPKTLEVEALELDK
ncbi:hypothetical protein CWE15_03615 [Aliidiomarina taiwanensis]|uniref:Uncharacterized protein n=1 Tax=Aliidiomarina taiwanensis TaxID=946228 RepID=A0A432XA36_9GAMM|nr:hypothetical protein [Aliidiomarina taiwanensis]RUO44268.1 hypothetical protein CWE15_03615 [Aliidiomarina taiwanensis]